MDEQYRSNMQVDISLMLLAAYAESFLGFARVSKRGTTVTDGILKRNGVRKASGNLGIPLGEVVVKATDAAYNCQPERPEPIWNLRGLNNNSWHRVNVQHRDD